MNFCVWTKNFSTWRRQLPAPKLCLSPPSSVIVPQAPAQCSTWNLRCNSALPTLHDFINQAVVTFTFSPRIIKTLKCKSMKNLKCPVLKFHSQIPVIPSWPTYFDELTSLPPRVAKLKDMPASYLLILLNHSEQRILIKGHVVSEKRVQKKGLVC